MKNHKGFSLVELIIVIAIMAILVGFMAPQLIKYVEKSNVSADMQLLDAVYNAVVYASVDPSVLEDPNSDAILSDMCDPLHPIPLQNLGDPSKYPAGNVFYHEVISTLGWNDLSQSTYEGFLRSAHASNATIYFTYKGDFVNPVIMWITTTDVSGEKDTSKTPAQYDESNSAVLEEIRSCIHIE